MALIHGRSAEGEEVKSTNPVLIGAKDINGNAILLTTDAEGKLRVATDLEIASVTATDVTIHDPTTPGNKLKINADGSLPVQLSGSKASEYEAITVDNTVGGKALTAAKYGTCTKAFMTLETAQIRYTVDGTAPTTSVGHLLNPGDVLKLDSAEDIVAFRAIRTGATSGSLRCTYSA